MTKPKGKTPSLLVQSTGIPIAEILTRKSACTRCKEDILSGKRCFRIPKTVSGFTTRKPYCLTCFRQILDKTKADIAELESEFNREQK